MSHQNLGEVKVFGRLVANFMGRSYLNILKPIWAAHPELEPEAMKKPHTAYGAELTPESREASQHGRPIARHYFAVPLAEPSPVAVPICSLLWMRVSGDGYGQRMFCGLCVATARVCRCFATGGMPHSAKCPCRVRRHGSTVRGDRRQQGWLSRPLPHFHPHPI